MNRKIVTDPLGTDDLWADLRANIELLKKSGFTTAMVFFGVGWGGDIYQDQWKEIPVSLDDLETDVRSLKKKALAAWEMTTFTSQLKNCRFA